MNTNKKTAGTLLIVLLFCHAAVGQSKSKRSHSSEQAEFSAEAEGVDKPIPIAEDVWAILKQDDMIRDALENEGMPSVKIPLSWFSASVIHLHDPGQKDL